MPRERLPGRRQAETLDLWHSGRRYHLTVGEYNDGRPGEVFLHGAKPGSDVDLLCDDIRPPLHGGYSRFGPSLHRCPV